VTTTQTSFILDIDDPKLRADLKRRPRHRELAINSRHDAPAAGLRQKGPVAESVASLEDFSVTDRIVHVPAHIRAGLGKNQKLAEINGGS